jgi:hypothetical protein
VKILVTNLTGELVSGAGDVSWNTDGDPVAEIKVSGGLYLLLCSIAVDLDQLNSDTFTATWSFLPPVYTYHTPQHRHTLSSYSVGATFIAATDSGYGARLVYQSPVQFWTWARLNAGEITLGLSHPAEVTLTAFRLGNVDHSLSLGLRLR